MASDSHLLGAAIFLGVLQGLTEFLPVSSSGHLVLFQQFFEIGTDHVLFDLVLHIGTLIPVLWFYRSEVRQVIVDPVAGQGPMLERAGARLLALIFVASVPTAIIGLAFEDLFEALFATPAALTVTFAVTGVLLYISGRVGKGSIGLAQMTFGTAALIGLAQGLAITPGISRSGTTIAVGLMLGLEREHAARFSFLMSVPAILGAVVLKLEDVDTANLHVPQALIGMIAALITGYLALVLLVRLVRRGGFSSFAYYCWGAAVVAGVLAVWRG